MLFELISTPENLRQEELIVQISDSLQCFENYTRTLFQHLEDKLSQMNEKLEDIGRRSEICGEKISQLKNEKKAITLYSHSKYPSREIKIKEFYQSFLVNNDKLNFNLKSDTTLNKHPIINATHIPYDDDSKIKSQFYIYDKQINVW